MTQYVALLRGIGPGNPNMRNDKLRSVFEALGFRNVRTVISSGNVLFETDSADVKSLESLVEKTFPERLGFKSTTIIRNREEIERLVHRNPFKDMEHSKKTSLNVTFLKAAPKITLKLPYTVHSYSTIVDIHDGALCSVIDLTSARTPGLMRWLEKEFGKDVTTRTWNTVNRILNNW